MLHLILDTVLLYCKNLKAPTQNDLYNFNRGVTPVGSRWR